MSVTVGGTTDVAGEIESSTQHPATEAAVRLHPRLWVGIHPV